MSFKHQELYSIFLMFHVLLSPVFLTWKKILLIPISSYSQSLSVKEASESESELSSLESSDDWLFEVSVADDASMGASGVL